MSRCIRFSKKLVTVYFSILSRYIQVYFTQYEVRSRCYRTDAIKILNSTVILGGCCHIRSSLLEQILTDFDVFPIFGRYSEGRFCKRIIDYCLRLFSMFSNFSFGKSPKSRKP